VQGSIDPKRNVPLIDLGTVRDTLAYIRDDLQRVHGLECAAELIAAALAEIQTPSAAGWRRSRARSWRPACCSGASTELDALKRCAELNLPMTCASATVLPSS
jgi:hypothetical protein